MKETRARNAVLAAIILACGTMGSIEWSNDEGRSLGVIRGGFTISASTAVAGEASGPTRRRASCILVRFYVARYSASAAEAWARSKGATDADIQTARRCIASTNRTDGPLTATN